MPHYLLDPNADLDFAFDWTAWLEENETITAQTVTPDDAGVNVTNITENAGIITYWLSGGTLNTVQRVTCHITTNMGRQDERTDTIQIVDR